MFSVFDIANFVKEKLDEYQVKFTSDDLPDGGKQFGVDYRGGNFKIRINDNKVSGASIDWSLVKNQTVTDELQRLLEGNLDKGVLQSSVYRSDDPTINVIGSDESGKGDLFGGIVTAAAWIHPELVPVLKEEGRIKDSKELEDRACMEIVSELVTDQSVIKRERDGYTQYTISAKDGKIHISVSVATAMQYNQMVAAHGENPEIALENLHLMTIADLIEDLGTGHCTDVDDLVAVVDQFVPKFNVDSELYHLTEKAAADNGFKEFKIELRERAEDKVLAVALASIFARVYFIRQIADLGMQMETNVPMGSGKAARRLYEDRLEGMTDFELAKFIKLKY